MELERDQNHVTVGGGVKDNNILDVRPLIVDPATNYALVSFSDSPEVPTAATMDKRDQNHVPTMYGVSSVDGVTPVPIRTDNDGYILVDAIPI